MEWKHQIFSDSERRPGSPIVTFSNEEAPKRFLDVMDWVYPQIRRAFTRSFAEMHGHVVGYFRSASNCSGVWRCSPTMSPVPRLSRTGALRSGEACFARPESFYISRGQPFRAFLEPAFPVPSGRRRLVRAQLRRADRGAGRGVAGDPGRPACADRRADRVGQDARRLPRGDRRPGPARRSDGGLAGRDAGRLRLAAEGAVQRHPAQSRSAARRHPRGAARARAAGRRDPHLGAHRRHAAGRARSACAGGRRTSSSPRRSRSTSCSAPSPAARCSRRRARSSSTRSTRSRRTSAARTSRSRSSGWRRSCGGRLLRIGLSATQKPIEEVARFPGRAPAAECRDRRHRPSPRARPRPRSAAVAARSGDVGRGLAAGLRPARRAGRGAPHDAGLRQHAAPGRAGRRASSRSGSATST